MLRTGIGFLLGLIIVVMLQVIHIHGETIFLDAHKHDIRATDSNKIVMPLSEHSEINENDKSDFNIPLKGFGPRKNVFISKNQSVHTPSIFEVNKPEMMKERKVILFFVILKFAKDSYGINAF
jgi:hypothetical protein